MLIYIYCFCGIFQLSVWINSVLMDTVRFFTIFIWGLFAGEMKYFDYFYVYPQKEYKMQKSMKYVLAIDVLIFLKTWSNLRGFKGILLTMEVNISWYILETIYSSFPLHSTWFQLKTTGIIKINAHCTQLLHV